MTYIFLNDKTIPLAVHTASVPGLSKIINPTQLVKVIIPENTTPYIKIWDKVVLLSYVENNIMRDLI